MLGNRHRHADDIYLLEAVASDKAARNVSGDRNHGDGVQISRSDTGNEVSRARTGGSDTHAHLSGSSCVAVSSMSRALLVGCENVVYPAAVEVQLIEEVDDLTAGISENGVAALFYQCFNDDFCT